MLPTRTPHINQRLLALRCETESRAQPAHTAAEDRHIYIPASRARLLHTLALSLDMIGALLQWGQWGC